MNINLVSPVENGNNFVIRFKDDIIIPEKSKVYLNFATLSRLNDVELYEDQTIKLIINSTYSETNGVLTTKNLVRPETIPTQPFNINKPLDTMEFIVPKGTYNYQRLYTLLETEFNKLLRNVDNTGDLSMYKAVSILDIDADKTQYIEGNITFSLGIMKNRSLSIPKTDVILDPNNQVNCSGAGLDGNIIGYTKTNTNTLQLTALFKASPNNVAGSGGFSPDEFDGNFSPGTDDKTISSYPSVPLISQNGVGNGGTISYNIITNGGLRKHGPDAFFTPFHVVGTADKTNGSYTNVNLISTTGIGQNGNINFNVVAGAIDRSSITIGLVGSGYAIYDELTISNAQTGGTQDTQLSVHLLSNVIDYSTLRIVNIGAGYQIGDIMSMGTPNAPEAGSTPDTINVFKLSLGSNLPFFDNYALSQQHYWHIGYDDNTIYSNANVIEFQSLRSIADMVVDSGCIQIGLYSQEYAKGLWGINGTGVYDDTARTRGTSIVASGNPIPKIVPTAGIKTQRELASLFHVSINCRGGTLATSYLEVWFGLNNATSVKDWVNANQLINGSRKVFSASLSTIPNLISVNNFKGGIQLYSDSKNLDDRRVYFRILNLNGMVRSNEAIDAQHQYNGFILFDSKATIGANGTYFNDTFFRNMAVDGLVPKIDYESGGAQTIIKKITGTSDKTDATYSNITISNLTRVVNGTATIFASGGLRVSYVVAGGAITNIIVSPNFYGTTCKVGDTFQIPNDAGNGGGTQDDIFEITEQSLEPRANRIKSQMPFNVIMTALTQGDGFGYVHGPFKTKDDTKPLTYIESYEIECSEELARYININTETNRSDGLTKVLYPNTGDASNSNLVHVEGMALDWRNESYSISLKELPIKNYKNNDKQKSGGYSKTILANCPVPFSDSQSYSTKSKQMITATYKPNYQIINNLYNQTLTTNHFSVEIRKLSSDKPANEILKSVINFTIMPPDDYSGNVNSVNIINDSNIKEI